MSSAVSSTFPGVLTKPWVLNRTTTLDVGFEMTEPGIARDGCDVYIDGDKCGTVTSGSPAPFLKKNIGLAFVPADFANEGQEIKIDVRGKQIGARVVPTPFYKRQK